MDNIGFNTLTARPPLSPSTDNKPTDDIQEMHQRLRKIQNCCKHCGSLWRQWQTEVDGMYKEMTGKNDGSAHPCRFVLSGMERLRSLGQKIVTREDAARLKIMGYNPAANETAGPAERVKTPNTALMDKCNDKAEMTNRDDERAAIHLYASQAMKGPLRTLVKSRLREAIASRNRDYHPAVNRLFPLRDILGNPLAISSIATSSLTAGSGKRYARTAIDPFVSPDLNGTERQMLYNSLKCRKLNKADLLPHETGLIGQWGVIAAINLPTASCIGVFSGTLVSAKEMGDSELFEHVYIIDISVKGQPTAYLDSDGILSKINTSFAYDEKGLPASQAELGYNVETVKFPAYLGNGRKINLIALFTTMPISAGTELRRNYHYSPKQVVNLFRSPHPALA